MFIFRVNMNWVSLVTVNWYWDFTSLLFSSKEGKKKKVKVLTRNKFSYFWVQMVPQKKPPSNLPTSIGAESRTQSKLMTSTPEVVQETVESIRVQGFLEPWLLSNSRMGGNHYKTPTFLACSVSFLPVPALHIHRKRLLSLLRRQNNQPEGHLMSWTSAWAMRGFRAKEPSAWQDAASCPCQNPAVSRGKKQTKSSDTGSTGKGDEKELAYFCSQYLSH